MKKENINYSNVVIETKRLLLKSISLNYKEDIFSEFTNEITIHMYPQPAEDIKETEEFITTSMAKNNAGTNLQIVVLKKDTGEFFGCGGLHNTEKNNPELGIWIKKSAHGNKYGLEAVKALNEWADKNLNYEYLLYPVVKENFASRKIPEVLGGKIEREFTSKNVKGKIMYEVEYRIYKKT